MNTFGSRQRDRRKIVDSLLPVLIYISVEHIRKCVLINSTHTDPQIGAYESEDNDGHEDNVTTDLCPTFISYLRAILPCFRLKAPNRCVV